MREKLVMAFIATFVVADVFLIGAAIRHVNAPPPSRLADAQPSVPTNSSTQPPTTPTPPAQTTTTPTKALRRAPVVMAVAGDGTILRATAGNCRSDNSVVVESSGDGGVSFQRVFDSAAQILQVAAESSSDFFMVVADSQCQPLAETSTNGGLFWYSSDATKGTWYLDPEVTSADVNAPPGERRLDCVPIALSAVARSTAVVGCADGGVRSTTDVGASWQTAGPVVGLVSLDFSDQSHGLALARQPVCAATVLTTSDLGQTWQRAACLRGHRPEAIAVSGDTAIAQVGGSVRVSHDRGQTWRPVR